ncbi:hypothetical protein TH606_01895 [Thermodesulfatator autotrophicus]|uniref:Uncharacterized protein n=1 Tax=Thermodesulfatator autotrophicus TaxID=1795632 RepID=A0A177E8S0_9BACT|nr:hypothetical protein TH606_01895 [Thermodesulfatator autotrophicus]
MAAIEEAVRENLKEAGRLMIKLSWKLSRNGFYSYCKPRILENSSKTGGMEESASSIQYSGRSR